MMNSYQRTKFIHHHAMVMAETLMGMASHVSMWDNTLLNVSKGFFV